jgi:hypothetical protein
MHRALSREFQLLRPRLLRPRPRIRQILRRQYGYPHKEYFQDPDNFPPTSSGNGRSPLPPPPHRGRYTAAPTPAPNFATPRGSSLLARIRSASIIGIVSLLLGLAAGNGLVSWGYLYPPFEPGSEEENAMMDQITEMMNESALLNSLQNDPAWEEWPNSSHMVSGDGGKGLHFVTGSLDGSKGIVQVNLITCLLFFSPRPPLSFTST